MTSSITSWLWGQAGASALVLVLARVAGLTWTAPALATSGLDWRLRLGLAALLGVILLPVIGPEVAVPAGWPALGRACLAEALIGAGLGWSAALIVAGARQAGEIVGAQAGLSAAALFDPDAGDDLTPLGRLYGWIALASFLALDGPLALVRSLVESYRVLPAGGVVLSEEAARVAFGRVGQALTLAVRAAAPTALALALAGAALGLLGRVAPSLQLVALSLPIRSALGMLLVLFGMITLAATLSAAWSVSLP
ncbi:MAG: flagellar biosynthetic protein FliR [Planctomycetaceae bacterium]|nr:flagellar biosynthetic protein FliR [Planctomycetaceae bacterium]